MGASHWRDGLEEVGHCPTCGAAVFVRPDPQAEAGTLPPLMYLCACRYTAANQQWIQPAPVPVPAQPTQPYRPQPTQPYRPQPTQPYRPTLPWPPLKWDDKSWESWNEKPDDGPKARSQFDVQLDSFNYPA